MKNFVRAAAIGLLLVAANAFAGTGFVTEQVVFRSGTTDSTVFSGSPSAAGTANRAVLTAPINTEKWSLPPAVGYQTTALDSVLFCRLVITPTNATGATVGTTDTLYVGVQVSLDGVNWTIAGNPSRTFLSGPDLNGVSPVWNLMPYGAKDDYFLSLRHLGTGNNSSPFPTIASTNSAIPQYSLFGAPFIRFSIQTTAKGQFTAYIQHWYQSSSEPTPVRQEVVWRSGSLGAFGGVVDSTSFSAAAARNDTTAAMYIGNWVPFAPEQNSAVAGNTTDTTGFLRLRIMPVIGGQSPNTGLVDTMYVYAQVSQNGQDWTTAMTSTTNLKTMVERTGTDCYQAAWGVQTGAASTFASVPVSVANSISINRIFGFPFIRFVTVTTGRAVGQYRAVLDGWKSPPQTF